MTIGRHIRAIGAGGDDGDRANEPASLAGEMANSASELDTLADQPAWHSEEAHSPSRSRHGAARTAATLGLLVMIGWTAFFAFTYRQPMLAGAPPAQWIGWISQWAIPVLLVAAAWLIAMRSSTREATRFGDAARSLAVESAQLEERLVTVNRELSLAREFLAAQSRELDYLGRAASERISEHAGKLQSLIADNGTQVEAIAGVSVTALENMTRLRDNLPVIANSARDVTNQIGGAGRTAKAQLGELAAGFERLNEFGQASERHVDTLRLRIDTAIEDLGAIVEAMDGNSAARIATLRQESERLHAELSAREADVHQAMRQRGIALQDEMMAAHDARQLEEAASLAAMRGRLATFTRDAHDAAAAVRSAERAAKDAWDRQVADLRHRLEQTIADIAQLDDQAAGSAKARLAWLVTEVESIDGQLAERDGDFARRMAERQAALDAAETAAFAGLEERAAALETQLGHRQQSQQAHLFAMLEHGDALAARLEEIDSHVASVAERSAMAERQLVASAGHITTATGASGERLGEIESSFARLIQHGDRLVDLVRSAADHSRSELPASLAGFEERIIAAREHSDHIHARLSESQRLGDDIAGSLAAVQETSGVAIGDLDALRSRLAGTVEEQGLALSDLRTQLLAASEANRALADDIAGRLGDTVACIGEQGREQLATLFHEQETAIARLRDQIATAQAEQAERGQAAIASAVQAIAGLRDAESEALANFDNAHGSRIAALANTVGERSAQAITQALETRTDEVIAELDTATARSAEVARQTVTDLESQLTRLQELTTNLEARAVQAREQVEEQVDSDFSRRMGLITESLNSHSIDIARALSTEVTDTAWASYLKGDRGIFTRRAVRLIDGGDARQITQLFEVDRDFREHVSRYIHDFEAMLRSVLATREGHALGVTLLSSDMGKLYVALAQAIQRLRQ